MQLIDTRSPTAAMRPPSDVDHSTATLAKTIAVVFALMMLTTTLAFGLTPAASAITAVAIIAALMVVYALTQPIIRWITTHRD